MSFNAQLDIYDNVYDSFGGFGSLHFEIGNFVCCDIVLVLRSCMRGPCCRWTRSLVPVENDGTINIILGHADL